MSGRPTVGAWLSASSSLKALESAVEVLDGLEQDLLVRDDAGKVVLDASMAVAGRLVNVQHALLDRHQRLVQLLLHEVSPPSCDEDAPSSSDSTVGDPAGEVEDSGSSGGSTSPDSGDRVFVCSKCCAVGRGDAARRGCGLPRGWEHLDPDACHECRWTTQRPARELASPVCSDCVGTLLDAVLALMKPRRAPAT